MSVSNPDDKWTPDAVTVAAGATGPWVIIPGFIRELSVSAIPGGGGSAVIEHTTSSPERVGGAGTPPQAVEWDAGSVNVATTRSMSGPVTAVRLKATAQPAVLEICGQRGRC